MDHLFQTIVALLGALQAIKFGKWGYTKLFIDRVPREHLEEAEKNQKQWHDLWVKTCREKSREAEQFGRRLQNLRDVIAGLKKGLAKSRGVKSHTEITNTGAITATQAQTHEQS